MTRAFWRVLALATLMASASLIPLAVAAQGEAPGEGTAILGRVVNGTEGFPSPEGVEVTLLFEDQEGVLRDAVATTDATGAYRIADLPPDGLALSLRADYLDVVYTSRLSGSVADLAESGAASVMTVHETTADLGALRVIDGTLVITGVDETSRWLGVLESLRLENPGDRTYVADPALGAAELLRFPLLPGAAGLEIESSLPGGRLIDLDGGVALTTPIPPGSHDFLFIYGAFYEGSEILYERGAPLSQGAFRVMVPLDSGTAQSVGMNALPPVTLGDRTYSLLEARDVPPGAILMVGFLGLPEPGLFESLRGVTERDGVRQGVVPAVAALGLVALLGFGMLRRRAHRPRAAAVTVSADGAESFDELAASVARLDEDHALGRVDDDPYHAEREVLMDRLRLASAERGMERGPETDGRP